ncbi:Peptidase T2, asparaginase 2 [Beauveria brongniartii RCEF 3172]|uniref:Peptidase T2, asparaginase 2 n=1 Tax=Beauveria brongniartii RCEF 3172 TaxID=1081107 RepID=A0A166XFP1_9HYPO|nr:Peptidase T2, asparaginase 2 [Beauveria brongniartii RCEF 3172]
MPGLAGIVIHGGASESWIGDKKRYDDTTAFLQTVVSSAESALGHGALAIDLAAEVVAKLEDYPAFNAGRGSAVNIDGNFELEAGIVCGATSGYRAAVCLQATKNPIKLVRAMLDDTGPSASVFIAGAGGDDLAKRLALDIVPNCYFATESRTSYWQRKRAEISEHGTVGAVVRDSHGNVAAANSTGGMMFKPVGRVGDTAVLGSGLYADKRVAIAWYEDDLALIRCGLPSPFLGRFSGGACFN